MVLTGISLEIYNISFTNPSSEGTTSNISFYNHTASNTLIDSSYFPYISTSLSTPTIKKINSNLSPVFNATFTASVLGIAPLNITYISKSGTYQKNYTKSDYVYDYTNNKINITILGVVQSTSGENNFTIVNDTNFPTNLAYGSSQVADGANLSVNGMPFNLTWTEERTKNFSILVYNASGVYDNEQIYTWDVNSFTANYGVSRDGRYTYNFTVCDYNNQCNTSATRTFTLDTTNPNATLLSPGNETYNSSSSINFTANLSDNLGIKNATMYLYNQSGIYNQSFISFIPNTIQTVVGFVVTMVDNVYNWFFKVFDWSGNSYTTQNNTVTVDLTNPLISYDTTTPPSGNITSNKNLSIFVLLTEINIKNITYNLYNSTQGILNSTAYTTNRTNTTFFNLSDGFYFYNVTAIDLALRTNSTVTRNITIDTTAPTSTASATSPPGSTAYTFNTWTGNDVKVTITGFDVGGFDSLTYPQYCVDTLNTCTPNTYIGSGVTISTQGVSYIRYRSVDYSGNSETIKNQTIKIDKIAPSISIVYPPNSTNSSNANLGVNYTVSDSDSTLSRCWWTNNSGLTNTTVTCGQNITSTWAQGLRTVTIYANDSVNNINYSTISFTIDTTNPNATLLTPANGSYQNVSANNFTANLSDNLGIKNTTLYVYNQSGLVNQTTTEYAPNTIQTIVGTVVTLLDNVYTWFFKTFDWAGNTFTSQNNTMTVDTTYPQISFNSNTEANGTSKQSGNFFINVTASDTNKGTIMWSLNGVNETFDNSAGNYYWENKTGLTTGTYLYYAWINDSVNHYNQTEVRTVYIDLSNPTVTIIDPKTQNYNYNTSIPLNYIATGDYLQACWWNLDSGTNNSIVCGQNTTFNISEGSHTATVYVNTTSGRVGNSTVPFQVSLLPPSISLDYPANNQWINNGTMQFNFTATDASGISVCRLWANFSGIWAINKTIANPPSGVRQAVNVTLPDGSYLWNVWCNNTGNQADWGNPFQNQTVNIDSVYPQIEFGANTPTTETNSTSTSIFVNVTATETNEKNITFRLYNNFTIYNTSSFTDNTRFVNFTGLPNGIYRFNVTIIDQALNSNSTSTRLVRLDNTAPVITIDEPKAQSYGDNNTVTLNYSVTDNVMGMKECWYYVQNSSGYTTVTTTSLATCQNTTFSLPGGDISYTLSLFAQDLLGNTNLKQVTFAIRTESPSIVLYPANDTQVNYLNNIYFNFTAFTLAPSIGTCELWGNFNGTWSKNQTKTSVSAYPTMNSFNPINLTQGTFLWNVWCNDSFNHAGWALNNITFVTDLSYPNVSITSISTTAGTQTFTFLSNVTATTVGNCKYTIFNSAGGIDGINNNVSFTCNYLGTATTSSYGTFNLTVYGTTKAGNENSSTMPFTTSASSGGTTGGGGGGSIETKIPVIGLNANQTLLKDYTNLQRSAIYSAINSYCSDKIRGNSLAVADYSAQCSLTSADLGVIRTNLFRLGVEIPIGDLLEFYLHYKAGDISQFFFTQEEVNKYNLYTSVLGLTVLLSFDKPSVDQPIIININGGEYTIDYQILASKSLASECLILDSNPDVTCVIANRTINIKYHLKDTKFFSKIVSTTISVKTDVQDTDKLETRKIPITFRVYNIGYALGGLPVWILVFGILVLAIAIVAVIYQKNRRKKINIGGFLP